jgi:hypothetical protein
MEKIKKYVIWILVLILIILLIIIFKQIFPSKARINDTVFLKDTSILTRYEKELEKDTVIKWYDKIVYKKSKPEIIYLQKVDTIFIEKTKELDLMLQVKKENNKLIIKAINQDGNILKEFIYDDVYNNFTAVSQKDNIYVNSKIFYWNRFNAILNAQWSIFSDKRLDVNFGLETGINFKNKLDINAGVLYSPKIKNLIFNTNLKIKF